MNLFSLLLDVSTTITPSNPAAAATDAAVKGADPAVAMSWTDQLMKNPAMVIVLYCVVLFAAMYFFSIRPNKKREQKLQDLRKAIAVGDSVILNSGIFGKVADITAECFIIEFGTNKGVRIPVLKQEVFGKREPNLSNKVEEAPPKEPRKGFFSKKTTEDTTTKE